MNSSSVEKLLQVEALQGWDLEEAAAEVEALGDRAGHGHAANTGGACSLQAWYGVFESDGFVGLVAEPSQCLQVEIRRRLDVRYVLARDDVVKAVEETVLPQVGHD